MARQVVRFAMITALVGALLPAAAAGQGFRGLVEVEEEQPRWLVGINGMLARPVGEFQQFVKWGGGLGLYGVVHFDRDRHFGLRLDGSYVLYGHESFSAPLSTTIPRVGVDVTTSNWFTSFGIGPQFNLAGGPLRPYVYGTIGFSYFATTSSVRGDADLFEFASSTNFDDFTGSLTAGGGLLIRLSSGRRPVSLDLAVQTTHNGEADYLKEGGIIDQPDGSLVLLPIRSETNVMLFRLGVAIGI